MRATILSVTACALIALCAGPAPGQDDEGTGLDADRLVELIERVSADRADGDSAMLPDDGSSPATARRIRRVLDTRRVTVDFRGASLADVVEYLQAVTGLNIVVDRAAADRFVDATVSIKLRDLRLSNLLAIVLRQVSDQLVYGIRHGVLWIGSREDVPTRTVFKVYNVEDVVRRPPDFPAPPMGLVQPR